LLEGRSLFLIKRSISKTTGKREKIKEGTRINVVKTENDLKKKPKMKNFN